MPFLKNSFYFNRTDFFSLHLSSEIHSGYRQNSAFDKGSNWKLLDLFRIHFCQSGGGSEPAQYLVWYSWCHLLKSL